MAAHDFQSLKSLLPALLSRLAQDSGRAGALRPVWEELAGPLLARQATPTRWERGQLILQVVEPGWLAELEQQGPELLARFQAKLGASAPRKLVFRLSS